MFDLDELPPVVLDWLRNSQDPKACAWRDYIYKMAQVQLDTVAKQQVEMKKESDTMPHQGKHMKRIGIIHPQHHADLQRQFEKRGGRGNWFCDQDFLDDTRKKNPQLFVE